MKSLVKSNAEKGLWLQDVAEPELSINGTIGPRGRFLSA